MNNNPFWNGQTNPLGVPPVTHAPPPRPAPADAPAQPARQPRR